MPLRATIDGVEVISTEMTDQAWERAREVARQDRARVLMGWSGLPCLPRTSSAGFRHFAHRPGIKPAAALSYRESAAHLLVKAELVAAVRAAGWSVRTEVLSRDRTWIADVLADKDDQRVVFEAQISPQSPEEYLRRQLRYLRAGVACYWFRGYTRAQAVSDLVPILDIQVDAGARSVQTLSGGEIGPYVRSMLESRFKQVASTDVWVSPCWRCGREVTWWQLAAGRRSTVRPDLTTEFVRELRDALGREKLLHPVLATARPRSTAAWRADLSGLHCPHCGSGHGETYSWDNATAFLGSVGVYVDGFESGVIWHKV